MSIAVEEKDMELLLKEHKALEIIKALDFIKLDKFKECYYICFAGIVIEIPKEAYDLLKEVLKDE